VRRRTFLGGLGGAAAFPLVALAQQKLPRIGFLRQAGPHEKQFEALRDGLRAAGYVAGQNIVIEQRYAAGAYDRLHALAMELVREHVDVIVVDGTAAAKACKGATATIPIVFALAVDPVADGLAASFARPDGNLTGLTMAAGYALAGKRVELLKDMMGSLSRVAVLSNPGNPPHVPYLRETERATSALGLAMHAFEVRGPNELPRAFAAMADWHADGLVTFTDGMLFSNRDRLAGTKFLHEPAPDSMRHTCLRAFRAKRWPTAPACAVTRSANGNEPRHPRRESGPPVGVSVPTFLSRSTGELAVES
jgi:putative ABC transport system substrate-binding protein